jgi:hypothetical protein
VRTVTASAFERDAKTKNLTQFPVVSSGASLTLIAFLLLGLAGATWWTKFWSHYVVETFKTGWDHPTLDMTPDSPPVDLLFQHIMTFTVWLLLTGGFSLAGVFAGVMIVYGMWEALGNVARELELGSAILSIARRFMGQLRGQLGTPSEREGDNDVVENRFTKLTQTIRRFFEEKFTGDRLRLLVMIRKLHLSIILSVPHRYT